MARLRIVIEGEISPEELKTYMAAAWSLKAHLPHDVALSTVDLDAEPATPVAPTEQLPVFADPILQGIMNTCPPPGTVLQGAIPAPLGPYPVVEPEPIPEPAPVEDSLVARMGKCATLAILIDRLETEGMEWDAILRTCLHHQKEVPLLERFGASLEDRLQRTKELML